MPSHLTAKRRWCRRHGITFFMRLDSKSARYLAEYAAFRLAAAIFGLLPVEAASALGGSIFRVIGRYSHKRNARAHANLAMAFPDWSKEQVEAAAGDMWENLGRVFAESFHLGELARSDRFTCVSPETFASLGSDGKGQIICAAHYGNWEIAALALGVVRPDIKVAGIYRHLNNPRVDAYVTQLRKRFYPGGLFVKSPSAPRYLIRHAKSGGAVAIMADLREFKGPAVPFFGQPAPSSPFPAMAALSLDAKLYAGRVLRLNGVRFRIELVEIPVSRTGDKEADILATTAALHAEFERQIREEPAQWMWSHRRWG